MLPLLQQASAKARVPYGASIEAALASAIKHLRDQPLRLEQCLKALKMTTPRALLWKRIKAVAPRGAP